uniref:Internal scaffolding protein n=1 Tax=Dulem virus 102 TaxID=3145579 RepID=A0AAU8B6L0_9VIRU
MKFRTQFEREPVKSNVGSREKITYGAFYDEDGRIVLEEKGRENLYDYIQSHRDSCDIHVLLKRYANGEVDVLSQVQGSYGDFTEMPRTYAELLNKINEGETFFNSLPVETRAKFGHSFTQFMASLDSPDLYEMLTGKKPVSEEPVKEKVTFGEVKEKPAVEEVKE